MSPPASRGLPRVVRIGVEGALRGIGLDGALRSVTPVHGGCIHHGCRLELSDGRTSVFLKWSEGVPRSMFAAEADGLRALRAVNVARVPEPLALGHDQGHGWLLMEYIEPGPDTRASDHRLGEALVAIHAHATGAIDFGLDHDNWIGSLPQANRPLRSWGEFWRDRRVGPQLDGARRRAAFGDRLADRVLEAIPRALADVTTPRRVHGDLWSGNRFASAHGEPVLVDPATYLGHGEVDLAMSELFGGFSAAFYDAYAAGSESQPAYRSHRRDLYQLYYLLVHVNLFGASYLGGARRAAERFLAAVG